MATQTKVDNLYETMDANVQPYKEENTKLAKRIEELTAQNDDLRNRLNDAIARQATLLERFSGKTTAGEEAAGPKERPNNTTSSPKPNSF